MSPDRFDVLERFAPLFDAPEPSFEGFLRRRDRKLRNRRIAAGVVAIVIFIAPLAIFAAMISSDRTQTPAGPRPTTPAVTEPTIPPETSSVGLVGLPPEGAAPSTPERGELVLDFGFGHTGGDAGRFSLHMYADGRVIWDRLDNPRTGFIEQRLTPEGVELVLAEVLSTGLFDRDRTLDADHGLHSGRIEVRAGDRLVHLAWGDAFLDDFEPGTPTSTPEQAAALERLDARIEDLASWLPESAWEDPGLRAYVPSWYTVCYSGQLIGMERPSVVDLLPAPAADLLRARETNADRFGGPGGSINYWCSVVPTEVARELVEILEDAGASKRTPDWLSYAFSRSGQSADEVDIDLDPLLPDFRVNEWLAA